MVQGVDTPLEEGCRGASSRLEAGSSEDQLIAGHLAGIIEFDQTRDALLETAGQGIGQREELLNHRIAAGV
jgi:hypothetical protein